MRRRGRRKAPAPGLTAMGDIAFLLITFFVLVSTMATEDQLVLELPQSQEVHTLDELEAAAVAKVAVDVDGRVYVDGDRVTLGQLEATLKPLMPTAGPAAGEAAPTGTASAAAGPTAEAATGAAEDEAEAGPLEPEWDRLVLVKMDKATDHETWFKVIEVLAELNAQVAIIADKE